MKKHFIIILLSVAITQSVYSQTTESEITAIEKTVNEIKNNKSTYQKTEKVNDSTGNGYSYKKGNELKLVTVYFRDIDANKNVEWYFDKGELIYAAQVWTDLKTNEIKDAQQFYSFNKHLIKWIKNNQPVDINSEEFKWVDTNLSAYGDKLMEGNK